MPLLKDLIAIGKGREARHHFDEMRHALIKWKTMCKSRGKQEGEPISAGRVWMVFKGVYA